MSDRLMIATRKGLFFAKSGPGGWALDGSHFLGTPVNLAMRDPRDGAIYAAIADGHFGAKLHRSDDGGKSFTEVATPAFLKAEDGEEEVPSVEVIWAMAPAGGDGKAGSIWAGTVPGGLFRSDDKGQSWTLNEPLWNDPDRQKWFGGGFGKPGIHSICVHPKDPAKVIVGVSCGGVWRTADEGATWAVKSKGMRAEYMPPDQAGDEATQDPHLVAQVRDHPDVLWVQHHNGIFRSENNSESWTEVKNDHPSAFGFAVAVHPHDPKTAWFVPARKDEYRYPVDGKFVVTRTTDGGKTFEVFSKGLPEIPSYDLVYRHGLDIDETGTRLAMGSTTGGVWASGDSGVSWAQIPARLPPVYCVRFV